MYVCMYSTYHPYGTHSQQVQYGTVLHFAVYLAFDDARVFTRRPADQTFDLHTAGRSYPRLGFSFLGISSRIRSFPLSSLLANVCTLRRSYPIIPPNLGTVRAIVGAAGYLNPRQPKVSRSVSSPLACMHVLCCFVCTVAVAAAAAAAKDSSKRQHRFPI